MALCRLPLLGTLLLTLVGAGAAGAGPEAFERWQALADGELEGMRGGFVTPGGLEIAIGVERLVLVNGDLQARLTVPLPAVRGVGGAGAEPLTFVVPEGAALIRTGPRNEGVLPSGIPLVVQNTLDGQLLQVLTRIDVRVTGLRGLAPNPLGPLLSEQLSRALR